MRAIISAVFTETRGPEAAADSPGSAASPRVRRTLTLWWQLAIGIGLLAGLSLTFKPVVQNDGIFYFSYLHAVTVEHSLDFTSEYAAAVAEHTHYDPVLIATTNAAGTPSNAFPVGPALLSLPFYLVALATTGGGVGQFGPPYALAFCLASLLAGLLALALALRLANEVVGSSGAAMVGAAAALLTTPFVYYLVFEPSYSHTFSAFVATLFVGWWWRTRGGRTAAEWFVLGLLAGVMGMTRFQDGALIAIALLDIREARWRLLWLVPGAVAGFAPQVVVDAIQFGTPLPYRPASLSLQPLPGHYLDVLFSSRHGLLAWHPGIAAAAVGLLFIRERKLQAAFVIAVAVEILIDGAAPDWDGGFAFGGRRFLVLLPFFVIGYASLAARLDRRVAITGLAALAAWNVVLIANLTYVIGDKQDPGYLALLLGQIRALRFVPREFAQGAVVRAIALWPVLRQPAQPAWGASLLALEAASVAVALAAALRVWRTTIDPKRSPLVRR
jgi:hypothetical protein